MCSDSQQQHSHLFLLLSKQGVSDKAIPLWADRVRSARRGATLAARKYGHLHPKTTYLSKSWDYCAHLFICSPAHRKVWYIWFKKKKKKFMEGPDIVCCVGNRVENETECLILTHLQQCQMVVLALRHLIPSITSWCSAWAKSQAENTEP